MKRLLYDAFFLFILLATATTVSAKAINLYSEPKTDSKVTGTINTQAGVTIVYTPKSSEWIKVANPSNGDVGWVKGSDLGDAGYNMRVFTSGDGSHRYSVYQLSSGNSQFNQKQLEIDMRNIEQQQRMLQIHMAHIFNDMFYFPQPVFVVPVVTVPERPKQQKTASAKAPHTTQAVQTAQVNKN